MSDHATTVTSYWTCAEARDWDGFAATLSPDVVYEAPQTRERVSGRDACVRFNAEYPGDWHLRIARLVADDDGAVTETAVEVGTEPMTGICFFTFDDAGLIATVRDFWPEPYEPPADRAHLAERY